MIFDTKKLSNIMIFIYLFLLLGAFSFAQTEEKPMSKERCLREFDIDTINLNNPSFLEKTSTKPYVLQDYYRCKSALNSDRSVCDKLNSGDAKRCKENYDVHHGFYQKLLFTHGSKQPVTRDMLSSCLKEWEYDTQNCMQILNAFMREDTSICQYPPFNRSVNNCKALITLNPNLADEKHVKKNINYIIAMRDFSVEACKQIKGTHGRRECEAYASGDIKVCEDYPEYRQFKDTYCLEVAQGKIKMGDDL